VTDLEKTFNNMIRTMVRNEIRQIISQTVPRDLIRQAAEDIAKKTIESKVNEYFIEDNVEKAVLAAIQKLAKKTWAGESVVKEELRTAIRNVCQDWARDNIQISVTKQKE